MLEIRLYSYDSDSRIIFLESPGDPHGRTAGAQGRNNHCDIAFRLPPDLLSRPVIMGSHVVGIVELVGTEISVRMFTHQMVGYLNGPVGALVCGREHQFRSQRPENALPLLACRLRHRQAESVTLGRRHQRQADTCIAAGRFQNHLILRQLPALFGLLDHMNGNPVLDRAARV